MNQQKNLSLSKKHLLEKILELSDLAIHHQELIMSLVRVNTVPKHHYLLQAGQVAEHIYFIDKGIVRVFHIDEDKEVTTYFANDSNFISAYSSFITREQSVQYVQTLSASTIISISYDAMSQLYTAVPSWNTLGRILAEQNFLCMADRVLALQGKTTEQKYQYFLDSVSEQTAESISLHHVASYLGMTAESLSRVRKRIKSKAI